MFATHMKKKNWFADTAPYLIFARLSGKNAVEYAGIIIYSRFN
ncbi:MAG: hypothetical protein O4805_15975 [Trichodesmium sp. St16_bin2-tuft]|nr:hypothetical protein [Trichodesmium sp. St16_bin2-tuft]